MEELLPLRPIIADSAFSIDEKMEMLEAAFDRQLRKEKKKLKEKAISQINGCKEIDKSDARIIVQGL